MTISYSGPEHLFLGGTKKRTREGVPARAFSTTRSRELLSFDISSGDQIVLAWADRPGTSSGRMAAPVARNR